MEEAVVTQKQPQDLKAERSIIGAILMNPDDVMKATDIISSEDFYSREYGVIFETLVKMYNEKIPIDPVTLQDKLRETGLPEEAFSDDVLNQFLNDVTTSAGVEGHCNIVYSKSVKRRLIKECANITNRCYSSKDGDLDSILDDTEKQIFKIVKNIEKAHNTDGTVTGIASGFTDLDYKTTGFQPSDLILLAARPSMGKTALALNIAIHVAAVERST